MSLGHPANPEDSPMRRRAVNNHRRGAISVKQLARALREAGFGFTRWNGSHAVWTHATGRAVVVPHGFLGARDLKTGTIAAISRDVLDITGYALEL